MSKSRNTFNSAVRDARILLFSDPDLRTKRPKRHNKAMLKQAVVAYQAAELDEDSLNMLAQEEL